MAKVNQDLLQKFQKASLAPKRQEADGHEIQACIQLHYILILLNIDVLLSVIRNYRLKYERMKNNLSSFKKSLIYS